MNPECRLQATAVAAAGLSPCLVHLCRTGPLDLWALVHLGSSGFHRHHHHSNQHLAFRCHPNFAAAVVALKLVVVQSVAAAVPFAAVAPTAAAVPELAADSAVAPKLAAAVAAPAVFVAVPQHTVPWWIHTAEAEAAV